MPITKEALQQVRLVVCHRNEANPCPDGVASAILLRDALTRRRLGDNFDPVIRFVSHGVELHELHPTPGALFCDIAPPTARAEEWAAAGALVLDHHKTARPVVEKFAAAGLGVFADESNEPGVSGAVLAFREVWKPLVGATREANEYHAAKWFARLAGIRDTWQTHDPNWRAACEQAEALTFWPWEKWPTTHAFHDAYITTMTDLLEIGVTLLERREADTKRLVAKGWEAPTKKGTKLLVIPSLATSDVAELVGDRVDLVVGFAYGTDPSGYPELTLSTRSHTTFDCAAFCKAHGGGGHTKAAGCSVLIEHDDRQPYAAIRNMLDVWEAGQ